MFLLEISGICENNWFILWYHLYQALSLYFHLSLRNLKICGELSTKSDCNDCNEDSVVVWYVLFWLYICLSAATVNTMGRYPCMGSLSICFHRCEHDSTRVIKQV